MSILVIVESPGKLSKIKSILGNDYTIAASVGHIRQLPRDNLGFDIDNNFEPDFMISPDKIEVVKKLKALAKKADKIILASDMDREGDAISWHCAEVCKIPLANRYRATFTEITKKAITTAINNLGVINLNSVYAQFARMILDKLIGYKLSPLLWKEYNNWHLSCGRVQSIVVKIISEREKEITKFTSKPVFKLDANFVIDKNDLGKTTHKLITTICETDITEQEYIELLYNKIKNTNQHYTNTNTNTNTTGNQLTPDDIKWVIKSIGKVASKHNPPPPFITSTLQQDASIKLGMSPDVCMKNAQKLYESGLITYMRTDANFIADEAMKTIKTFIETKWGVKYYRRIDYKTKSANAQEGHECCRPSDITKETVMGIEGITSHHNRLYQLIWRRTVASQMSPSEFEIFTIKCGISDPSKPNKISKIKKTIMQDTQSDTKPDTQPDTQPDTVYDINNISFVGKYDKLIFDGYLVCNNLHKKPQTTSTNTSTSTNTNTTLSNSEIDDTLEPDTDGDEDADADADNDITTSSNSNYLEKVFTQLQQGTQLYINNINAIQKYTKPPHSRYTEASLIKKLDDLGIGRPSTYSSMIKKVQEEQRQYVEKKSLPASKVNITSLNFGYPDIININNIAGKIEGDKNKLMPTSLGLMINDYLDKNFIDLMNYEFTAKVELMLDEIALGTKIWYKVVESVYINISPLIDVLSKAVSTRKASATTIDNSNANTNTNANVENENKKLLGYHPETQIPIYALKSRKGYLICESNPEKEKSRFANFTGIFEMMTLDKALLLLVFPRVLGKMCSSASDTQNTQIANSLEPDIILKKAKNIYLSYDGKNYSIENYIKAVEKQNIDISPETLTLEQARTILHYYENANAMRIENAKNDKLLNDEIIIKVGPYGAYIKYKGEYNIPLPKKLKTVWETITLEECLPVIDKFTSSNAKYKFSTKPKLNPKPNTNPNVKLKSNTTKDTTKIKSTKTADSTNIDNNLDDDVSIVNSDNDHSDNDNSDKAVNISLSSTSIINKTKPKPEPKPKSEHKPKSASKVKPKTPK